MSKTDTLIADRYVLQEELGAGGMGTVYKGLDTRTDTLVAIKQLKRELTAPELIERFKREGEALCDLNHPNIVKMLDTAEEHGSHFLVMEYISGGDLASLIERHGRFNYRRCVDMAIDLADALTRAHRLNIIHRDLKPANVLIGEDGTLRLTDFGLAHVGSKHRVTDMNAVIGTIDYLPPESFRGVMFDERGDIWAFGVILFEMLTGQHPFARDTFHATLMAITSSSPPDIEEIAPGIPAALADLIYRMLEKQLQTRIPSVRVVGAELEAILFGRSGGGGGGDGAGVSGTRFVKPTPTHTLRRQHNLPAQTTPFVGREHELEELAKLMSSPAGLLVTVLAPGGMGKTRLALELAARHVEAFENGVYFIDLTPLSDPASIIITIAEATQFSFSSDSRSPKQQVLNFLANKHMLLVMDNFEHLVEGAALVTEILQDAPTVRILATSRQRLDQPGETLFHLSGMDFPDWKNPEDALNYAAMQLFMNSASRIQPGFELTSDNLKAVTRICHLVEGMPLGIVLAAGWLGMLSPAEIVAEIQDSIGFLESTGGDVSERQRSIQVIFEYSWQMMDTDEQQIFAQLSVFRGGFTRQAAQSVTGASLKQLMSLINKSLIRRDVVSGRYTIHELLRQFAMDKLLRSGERSAIEDAHRAYYRDMLAEHTPHLEGSRELEALDAIQADFENVRTAWESGYAAQNWLDLRTMVEPLYLFGEMRTRSDDVVKLFEPMIAQFTAAASLTQAQESLLVCLAGWYVHGSEINLQRHEQIAWLGLELAWKLDDRRGILRCQLQLAHAIGNQGRVEEAISWLEGCVPLCRDLGDHYTYCSVLTLASYYQFVKGDFDVAVSLTHECLEIARMIGNKIQTAVSLHNLASALRLDQPDQAIILNREALAIRRVLGDSVGIGWSLSNLCSDLITLMRLDEVDPPLAELTSLAMETNDPHLFGYVHWTEAVLHFVREHYEDAMVSLGHAAAHLERTGDYFSAHASGLQAIKCAVLAMLDDLEACTACLKGIIIYGLIADVLSFALVRLFDARHEDVKCLELLSTYVNHPHVTPSFVQHPYILRLDARLKHDQAADTYQAVWERGKTHELAAYLQTLVAELPSASV